MSAVKLTGRMTNFSKLTLNSSVAQEIETALHILLGSHIAAYKGTLIILDSTVRLSLDMALSVVRQFGLQVIAVSEGLLAEQAKIKMIPVLAEDNKIQKIAAADSVDASQDTSATSLKPSTTAQQHVLVQEVVRTGQRVHNPQGDLVLVGGINPQCEVIAGGNITVWGKSNGRLIAGTNGATGAYILCQHFDAELVSIDGTYIIAEDFPEGIIGKAILITLGDNMQLLFSPLNEK